MALMMSVCTRFFEGGYSTWSDTINNSVINKRSVLTKSSVLSNRQGSEIVQEPLVNINLHVHYVFLVGQSLIDLDFVAVGEGGRLCQVIRPEAALNLPCRDSTLSQRLRVPNTHKLLLWRCLALCPLNCSKHLK